MSSVETGPKMEFHPNGRVREIISDERLSDEEKKRLIASLGPDAGEFVLSEASEAKVG